MARWGVHPVLEPVLQAVGEDEVPAELERVIPAPGRLSIHALLEVVSVCIEHARAKVSKRSSGDFDRLAALVARQLAADAAGGREPWHRDLAHARRDFEHGRGAIKVAALAAEVAHCDVMRHAPGVGPEASALAAAAVGQAARLLAADRPALLALAHALCVKVGAVSDR